MSDPAMPTVLDPPRQAQELAPLRTMIDAVSHFVGLLAPDGVLLEANRAALELVGARPQDVLGKPFADGPWFAHDPRQQQQLRAALREAAGGRVVRLDTAHPTLDRGPIEVELTLTPILDGDGRVARIVPEGRDITAQRQAERMRDEAAQRFSAIIDLAADAIVSIDADQRIVLFNQGAAATFGYTPEEVHGQPLTLLLPEDVHGRHAAYVDRFEQASETARYMNQRGAILGRRRNGELFPAEATISRVVIDGRRLYTAVVRDISERRARENELARSRQHVEAILGSVAEGVVGLDREGRATFANPAACRLLGYDAGELIGRELHALIHHSRADGTPYPVDKCPAWAATHEGVAAHCEHETYWRADGTALPVEYTATPLLVGGLAEGAVVVFRDISGRRQAEALLRAQSLLDDLTGLYNRRGFMAQATEALQHAQASGLPCLLLFADLDDLKPINDLHGHLAGDRALRTAARVLREVFRDSDIIGRYGGDEFVILACGSRDPAAVEILRARLQATLDASNRRDEAGVPISISVGTAVYDPAAPEPLESLMGRADAALYARKRARQAPR